MVESPIRPMWAAPSPAPSYTIVRSPGWWRTVVVVAAVGGGAGAGGAIVAQARGAHDGTIAATPRAEAPGGRDPGHRPLDASRPDGWVRRGRSAILSGCPAA